MSRGINRTFFAYGYFGCTRRIVSRRECSSRQTAPRIPLDKVLFPLRERGLVGACTNSNCLCYNSFTGQGQLLWVGVCL